MGKYFLINAFGKDKPGIVAEVSKILYENGFNLENSTMSRLADEFTIMLVVYTEDNFTTDEVKKIFLPVKDKLGLNIYVKEIDYKEEDKKDTLYKVIVYGGDKPGIVYKVAKLLAENNINIVDMTTEKSQDIYVLITDVEIPDSIDFEEFRAKIKQLQYDIDVDISCEKIEVLEL
ncbi:MAG: amino acid-binding protein [Persephonella sp.]|nr:MAG: amino acid-binding protein [Persephonella sp.]RUM62114.1 MAG: amino acid-binding protein [Persephonella sp.]